jgi:hypothetical protein
MQPFTRMPAEVAGSNDPPVDGISSEMDKLVPDSFADWLAQPSCTITAGPDQEPGVWVQVDGRSLD